MYIIGKVGRNGLTIQLAEDHGQPAEFKTLEEALKFYQHMSIGIPMGQIRLLKVIEVNITALDDKE